MGALAVRVMGPLEVVRDGREVVVPGLRRRALLVRLVVSANDAVPSGRLIEDLWDGAPPPGAASTLQSHVSALRGLIGSDRIRFGDGGYMLALGDDECDVASLHELSEARRAERSGELELALASLEHWLGRWRGAALEDVAGASWAAGEVTRLEELRAGATEQWLKVRLGLGDHATVVADAERAVSEYPLREGFWGALMLAQYRSGRQSDALRSFGRLRKVLGEELGIEPSAELRALEDAMLLQRPDLDWRPPAAVPGSPHRKALPSGTVTFLVTDIDGSTALMEQVGDDVYEQLLQEHHRIVRGAIAAHDGVEVSADGAGFLIVFSDAGQALATAIDTQTALCGLGDSPACQARVRMGLHTGAGRRVGDTYAGLAVHQASLVCKAVQGGQIVATQATRLAAEEPADGSSWLPLGRHRLQGLSLPLELHQLCHPTLDEDFAPLQSLGTLTHHLPAQVSSFLGRAEELAIGAKLLATSRLVSVVGPGGAGKTRVAYQLAEAQRSQFPDGVWVVELAPETHAQRIPALLLSGLGLRDEPGRAATESVVSYLRDRRALVVLDNCEHLLDAAASFAAELLGACSQLRVLATSREALHTAGESILQVGPLQLPDAKETELSVIAGTDAVALFCERAAAILVEFGLDRANVETVTRICRSTEGMPLAIELAAAWVRTLPLTEIAERLEQSFDLLSKGRHHGSDRHSSLRATVTWSHDLLAPTEQVLFRRLAVFAGGFTLAAAQSVGPGEGLDGSEVLDALDGLVDKSLVTFSLDHAGQGRYWILETVRTFGHERSAAAGELATQTERHAEFYFRMAGDFAAEGATRPACDRLEVDHSNLLAALAHLAGGEQPSEHGRLVLNLSEFWDLRGYWRLGERELMRYLARSDRGDALEANCRRRLAAFAARFGDYSTARTRYLEAMAAARRIGDRGEEATSLGGLGQLAWFQADYAESAARYGDALVIAQDRGDRVMEAKWLLNLGMVAHGLASYDEARSRYGSAAEIAREVGNRSIEASTIGAQGSLASNLGDYHDALAHYEEALAIFREVGERYTEAGYLGNIGRISMRLGDYPAAQSRLEDALAIVRDIGDRRSEGIWLGSLGEVACEIGDYQVARRRFEAALAIARELGDRRSQRDWLGDLGGIECKLGRHTEAGAHYRHALVVARELGRPDDLLLEACAELLVALGRFEDATELVGVADAISAQARRCPSLSERSRHDTSLATCRSQLSEQAFELAYERGRASDWACAAARAMELLED